jgi:hypothetical protein
MQRDPHRLWDRLIDRVPDELVAEHEHAAMVGHQAGRKGRSEVIDELRHAAAGDRGHIRERERLPEERRSAQRFDRGLGHVAEPPRHELPDRARQFPRQQLCHSAGTIDPPLGRQCPQQLHHPQRIPSAAPYNFRNAPTQRHAKLGFAEHFDIRIG